MFDQLNDCVSRSEASFSEIILSSFSVSSLITSLTVLVLSVESLRSYVFESRTETGSEHFSYKDSGLSQIFKLIVSTSEKIFTDNINVVLRRQFKCVHSSTPVVVRGSKTPC